MSIRAAAESSARSHGKKSSIAKREAEELRAHWGTRCGTDYERFMQTCITALEKTSDLEAELEVLFLNLYCGVEVVE